MKRILSLIILLMAFSSVCYAVAPVTDISSSDYESVFRTNVYDGTSRGAYVNTVAPNFGLIPIITKTVPVSTNVQNSTMVVYLTTTAGTASLNYIAKDASGNTLTGTFSID